MDNSKPLQVRITHTDTTQEVTDLETFLLLVTGDDRIVVTEHILKGNVYYGRVCDELVAVNLVVKYVDLKDKS